MGKGRGSGKFDGECCFITFVIIGISVLIVLELIKFGVGIHYWNDCPARTSIPKYMVGSASAETINDVVGGCISAFDIKGSSSIVVGHLVGIIVGSIYVFKDYSYLVNGCNGASQCCNEDFIKIAFGCAITEWIFILLAMFIASILIAK